MMRGRYVGPIKHLREKTAILHAAAGNAFAAQFDDVTATESGDSIGAPSDHPPPPDALGYGWHIFNRSDFRLIPGEDADV